MSATRKTWRLRTPTPEAAIRLAGELGVSPYVAQLLIHRGVFTAPHARLFLEAPMTAWHAPDRVPGVPDAAHRLINAIQEKKRICVYGDYDVDGVTGAAILLTVLKALGAQADYYIPNRLEEGYGLNAEAVQQIHANGTQIVITVDCGIASLKEAELARSLGLELIITDHHEMKAELPVATVLVHPKLPGSEYPFAGLSGAGVAFKLAWALAQRASGAERVTPQLREVLLDLVGLAALGLVADVMPLHDENRVFVRHGLKRIVDRPSVGLKALLEASGVGKDKPIKAEDVSFKLGPRINAAGRLGCARLVVELLTTNNNIRAKEIAAFLEDQNQERQRKEREMGKQAREQIEAHGYDKAPALVLDSDEWHPGVVGIVAGRIAEQYARPTILIARKPGELVAGGSGRAGGPLPLHEALQACTSELLSHGGHAAAAGLKLNSDRIPAFREMFIQHVAKYFPDGLPTPELWMDDEVPLSALTMGLMKEIDKLEPYGQGNTRPRFLSAGLTLEGEPRKVGQGERHLNFRVRQGGSVMRAVAFGMGDRFEELKSAGGAISLAFTPKVNEWNGYRNVEMEVTDFQAAAKPDVK